MTTVCARPDSFASNDEWKAAGFPTPADSSDYRVAKVQVVGSLTLWVEHKDGVQRRVKFEDTALIGVFSPLKNPEVFRQVSVEHCAVTWPNGLDLAPDNMHRHLAAFGEWVLT